MNGRMLGILGGILLPGLLFLGGCGVPEEVPDAAPGIADYVPVEADVRSVFEGSGSEYAAFTVCTDYILGDRFQLCRENAGTTVAEVREIRDGALRVLYRRGEAYYREDYLRNPALMAYEGTVESEVLLMEPLEVGTAWTGSRGESRSITAVDKEVQVPAGTFRALEVTTRYADGSLDRAYYARGTGLVLQVFEGGGSSVTASLSRVERGVPRTIRTAFWYPDLEGDRLVRRSLEVPFHTDEVSRQVLEKAYREGWTEGTGKVFPPGAKVNFLYLDGEGAVHLDLSRAFLTEMNAGALYESRILQSLANTFGGFYGASRVWLTLDGAPYVSGHVDMTEAFLPVELSGGMELP